MKIIWTIIVGLVAIMAVVMALAIIAVFGIQPLLWMILGFWTIIMYRILPKPFSTFAISMATVGFCFYFVFFYLSVFVYQPIHYLIKMALAVCAVLALLKGKPRWLWIIVATVYVGFGIYFFFFNDIIGPMTFFMMDRPVNTPAQWYHCYRFFWTGIYLDGVMWYSSIISTIVISMYIVWNRYKDRVHDVLLSDL